MLSYLLRSMHAHTCSFVTLCHRTANPLAVEKSKGKSGWLRTLQLQHSSLTPAACPHGAIQQQVP